MHGGSPENQMNSIASISLRSDWTFCWRTCRRSVGVSESIHRMRVTSTSSPSSSKPFRRGGTPCSRSASSGHILVTPCSEFALEIQAHGTSTLPKNIQRERSWTGPRNPSLMIGRCGTEGSPGSNETRDQRLDPGGLTSATGRSRPNTANPVVPRTPKTKAVMRFVSGLIRHRNAPARAAPATKTSRIR